MTRRGKRKDTSEALVKANDEPTKLERAEKIRLEMIGKFNDDEKPLVEWLSENMGVSLWPTHDSKEVTWCQQLGESFTIIGKTGRSKLADEIGNFFAAYEEMNNGTMPLNRFSVEVDVVNSEGVHMKFDCILSELKTSIEKKATKWEELGIGNPKDLNIGFVKITDTIPF